MLASRLYRDGRLVRTDLPLEELGTAASEKGTALWIDCADDDRAVLHELARIFDLHPVAVEDALSEHERPKLDRYEKHIFLTAYGTESVPDPQPGAPPLIRLHEVNVFLTRTTMITVRPRSGPDPARVYEVWEAHPELLAHGASAMLWALLDGIVDSHFDTVQALDEYAGEIEDKVFGDRPDTRGAQQSLYVLHKRATFLRRIALPMRDITGAVVRFGSQATHGPLMPYLQDVYDHTLRVADWMDNLHDTVGTLFDSNLTAQSNRMNSVMKKVTSWAAIIAVPTLVTGYFGMNVEFPFFNTAQGWWIAVGAILVPSAILYWLFRRSDWL